MKRPNQLIGSICTHECSASAMRYAIWGRAGERGGEVVEILASDWLVS